MRSLQSPLFACLLLSACASGSDDAVPVERAARRPIEISVSGEGKLRAAHAEPLLVPGTAWSNRQLIELRDDGSWVEAGDLLARFAANESQLQLGQALLELQRTQLLREGAQAQLDDAEGKIDVDIAQVQGLLGIARRYAHATQGALARNDVLDAVQDASFLTSKQQTLQWRQGQSRARGAAELALNDAQRASSEMQVKTRRSDLDALEVHAPHAGLFVLEADWAEQKPHLGQSMWAGNTFATLPDPNDLELQVELPQADAVGVHEGLTAVIAPLGAPKEAVTSTVSWVAAAPAPRGRESPVKFLSLKVSVPADAAKRGHWAPGRLFTARIVLLKGEAVLSVPNIALEDVDGTTSVTLREHGQTVRRALQLGVRGTTRSEVITGLKPGDEIVLAPPRASASAPHGAPAGARP